MTLRTVLSLLCVWMASGCGVTPAGKTIGSSLSDLTFEGRRQRSRYIEYTEFFSLNGLVPAPDVGVFYHNPGGPDRFGPGHTIGFSRLGEETSYRLIGHTSSNISVCDVKEASKRIAEVEQRAAAAVRLLIELSGIDARIAQQADAALSNRRNEVAKSLAEAESELEKAIDTARNAIMKEGLIVARWSTANEARGTLKTGSLAEIAGHASASRNGYMVLGNVRVVYLFLGRDYAEALRSTSDDFRMLVSQLGITTYLLQARHISYGASLDLVAQVRLQVDLQAKQLALPTTHVLNHLDTIRFSTYVSAVANLQNQGVVSEFKWQRVPMRFGWLRRDRNDKIIQPFELIEAEDMSLVPMADGTRLAHLPEEREAGWKTVQVIYARAPFLNRYAAEGGLNFGTLFWWLW